MLTLLRTCHRPARQTLSDTFLKSMKLWNRSAGVVVFLFDDLTIDELFYCAPAWSKTCLFFCQQFLSTGLESVGENSEHDLAGMTDKADYTIVLTLTEVDFL